MDNRLHCNQVEFDTLQQEERFAIQCRLLYRLFKNINGHPLVRERIFHLKENDLLAHTREAMKSVQVAEASDHMSIYMDNFRRNPAVHGGDTCIAFSSGGTCSGKTKTTFLTFNEVLRNTRFHGKGYRLAGVTKEDIVATWGMPNILSSEYTVYHGLNQTGCTILPIGTTETSAIYNIINQFKANVLLVMPSDLYPLLEYLEGKGEKLDINLLLTGGEALNGKLKQKFIKLVANQKLKFRSTYQSSDNGTIGFQCSFCNDDEYHIHEELQYAEFVSVSGENSKIKELVLTNMDRYFMPVFRVATGDLVVQLGRECPCGRTTNKIRLIGRKGKILLIGGEKLNTSVFDDLANTFEIPREQYSVFIDRTDSGKDRISLYVPRLFTEKRYVEAIQATILNDNLKLAKQIITGTVDSIQVKQFQQSKKIRSQSGKTVNLRDFRDQAS